MIPGERNREMTSGAVELVKALSDDYTAAQGTRPTDRVAVQLAILDVLIGIQEILKDKLGGGVEFGGSEPEAGNGED